MTVSTVQTKLRKRRSLKKVQLQNKRAARQAVAMADPQSNAGASEDLQQQKFAAARQLLSELIKVPEIQQQFDPQLRTCSQMVYTKGVTLWMLILQRLGNGLSLE